MFSGSSTGLQKAPRNHLLNNLRKPDDCVRQLPQRFRDLHLLNYFFLYPRWESNPQQIDFESTASANCATRINCPNMSKNSVLYFLLLFNYTFKFWNLKIFLENFLQYFFVFQIQVNYTIRILFWKIFFNFFEKLFCTYGRIRTPESLA